MMQSAEYWYVIKSKPRKERVLYREVRSRKIECFFPWIAVKPVNPRSAKIRPYFPGYLFVQVALDEVGLSTFSWMPFSQGLVSFGGDPATVPDTLISALKKRMQEIHDKGESNYAQIKAGAPLRIIDGPFQGYDAIFDMQLDGDDRVRILLQMLNNRRVPVEMHAGQIVQTK